MIAEPSRQTGTRVYLLLLGLLAIFLLLPLGYTALTGEAEVGATGISRMTTAVKSITCADGYTPVTTIFLVEFGILALAIGFAFLRPKGWALEWLREHGPLFLVAVGLIIMPFIIAWGTDSSVCSRGRAFFWQSILVEIFLLSALAISYNLMFGFSGVISFGHAAFFGAGAYAVGLLMLHLEWPLGLSVLTALIISVLMGLLISVIALRIRGLYFAIFTLAFAEIFFILSQNRILTEITGAEDGFTFLVPDWINATKNRLTFYYIGLLFLIFTFWLVRRLVQSPAGRVLNALRDNEDRAQMLGYNTFVYKTLAIVLAGVMATGAGVLRGLLNKGASPNVLGVDFTMQPLLMTLIGGSGTYSGPVVGAFFLRLTEQLLRDTIVIIGTVEINIGERWALILGVVFILIVILFPSGIVGTLRTQWEKWKARRQSSSNSGTQGTQPGR